MRVVFLSTTSSNLVIHVSSAEFLHLVYFPYTFSTTSAIHRTRTLIEAWCCCCWQICTSLTLSPLPLLTQNFSRIWKDHPEVRKDKGTITWYGGGLWRGKRTRPRFESWREPTPRPCFWTKRSAPRPKTKPFLALRKMSSSSVSQREIWFPQALSKIW